MNKILAAALSLAWLPAQAVDYTVCDFDDYDIGHTFKIWNNYGGTSETTAIVEADPADPSNKVLHITLKGWNDYIEFELDEDFYGPALTANCKSLSADIRRHDNDPCGEWKNFTIFYGSDKLYEESFPSYGPVSVWSTHTYELATVPDTNTSNKLRIGFNSENTDYYLDNVVLSGYDVFTDGKLDFSDPGSTSSSYTTYDKGINIPEGTTLDVYTSRYTYWTSPVIGSGRLNIHCGGERVYLGTTKGAAYPDWSGFTGDVHLYPHDMGQKPGFYGLVLAPGGDKFASDDVKGSIEGRRYTPVLEENAVTLHPGTTLAAEGNSTARAFRFSRLAMEEGSHLYGHIKNAAYRVYFIAGHDGRDSELAGKIAPAGSSSLLGLIKEGTGTYRITGNDNNISGILSVIGGKVLIDNDVKAAREQKLAGAVGLGTNTSGVVVYTGGSVGGNGHISALTDVYGHLEPGSTLPGTLTIADFINAAKLDLRVHPSSRLIFKIAKADAADRLDISGNIVLDTRLETLETSEELPILEIRLPLGHDLKKGDTFTIISAAGATEDVKWRVQYPKAYTWQLTENRADGIYTVTATVTSTDYSGQGDTVYEDMYDDETVDNSDYLVDYSSDFNDGTPLRKYAEKMGKYVGVAIPSSRYSLEIPDDPKSTIAAREFNIVVAENETKIDWTEPERGVFSLGETERLHDFAKANGMAMRGHTLVWHSQVPSWISSNGKKNDRNYTRDELLEIMKDHINGVAGGLRGKMREWDVVNECLDDNQSTVRDNPDSYTLRQSVWKAAIGDDFIEQAFRMAHEADPDALLYLNDYGVEFLGQPKAEAFYNLAKSLVEKGVPLHGVGLQCHITVGELNARKLAANIARYQELGLKCIITELDIAQANPYAPDAMKRQAEEYCATVYAALAQDNCPTVLIWGLADSDSWRENNPLLYGGDLVAKEAYYGVHAALRSLAGETSGTPEPAVVSEADVMGTELYNLQGIRVADDSKGYLIKRIIRTDGSSETIKVLVK